MTAGAQSVLALLDEQRRAHPGGLAVVDDGSRRTYTKLDLDADRWAATLQRNGVGLEDLVPVMTTRCPDYLAMVLGVLRAGAAFLPIDADLPLRRAQQMCRGVGARAVVVQSGRQDHAAALFYRCVSRPAPVLLTQVTDVGADAPVVVRPRRHPSGLAYVLFTSGSTGVPKGAMVTDGGLENHIAAKRVDLALGPDDVVGFTAPLSFDVSVWQALTVLTVGGTVCVASRLNVSEPVELLAWVRRHRVTVLELVPSFMSLLLEELKDNRHLRASLASLRFLVATGEPLSGALARRWYELCPEILLVNAYGPTECSDDVTHHIVTHDESATTAWASIGREILNTRIYVVDAVGCEAGLGVEGEVLIGGRGVGRGYLSDPRRTALAFVPDHLSNDRGARLYRSGDRGARRDDGALEFLGRRDRQIKVRGQRVELGDVEAELLQVPGVRSAACVYADGQVRAFVALEDGLTDEGGSDRVLERMRASAPAFLVPHEVTVLDRIPTSTAGKIDHEALRARPAVTVASDGDVPLAVERTLFAEVLKTPVGPDDDFFRSGGDSLLAMRLVSMARKRFGLEEVPLRCFLDDPTPSGLAAVVDTARQRASEQPDTAVAERAPGQLSSGQERLWFLEQLQRRRPPQLIRLGLTLRGPLDLGALRHALAALVVRHEPLRTVFSQSRGVPIATVWPRAEVPLEFIDADPHHDGEGVPAAVDLSARTATPPLMVARLARVAPDHHVLTVLLHHLIADGWSLAILGDEVRTYYQRWVDGEHDVPGPETTFSQYVARERSWLASPDAAECEQYWLDQLKDAPVVIDLPFDRPRFDRPDFITDHGICELTAEETEGVAAVARAVGATPFMAVTAALYAVLRQLVGSDDVVVGIDSVNRSWPGSDELIGTFVNQLPLRLRSDDRPTFASLLALVRRQCLAAYQHERLPFHKIVAAVNPPRQAGRFPLFQVKVTHQGAWRTALALPDIEVVPAEISEVAMDLDLMLDVSGETSQLRLELVYRREVVDRETAIGWLDAVATVLRSGARRPHAVLPGTVWRNRAIDARVD